MRRERSPSGRICLSLRAGTGYRELYALRYDGDTLIKTTTASIYGTGSNAILGTDDPVTGNGAGCVDGYWWFNAKGAQPVDFGPLQAAIQHAIPSSATFLSHCWALNLQSMHLTSYVQQKDVTCNGCGMLGEVDASYRIDQGVARPVSVSFRPRTP